MLANATFFYGKDISATATKIANVRTSLPDGEPLQFLPFRQLEISGYRHWLTYHNWESLSSIQK